MQRKLFRTSFLVILLLVSLLLSGCGTPPTFPRPFVTQFLNMENENGYEVERDTYSFTFGYGHMKDTPIEDVGKYAGVVKCRGYGEDLVPFTALEVALEISDFYAEENRAEKRLKWFKTTYEPKQFVTVEIPKEYFVGEKGYVAFCFGIYVIDQAGNPSYLQGTGACVAVEYEQKDGKVYVTELPYESKNYSIYDVFFKNYEDENLFTQ